MKNLCIFLILCFSTYIFFQQSFNEIMIQICCFLISPIILLFYIPYRLMYYENKSIHIIDKDGTIRETKNVTIRKN